MTTLQIATLAIPSAHFGGENPLPPLSALHAASAIRHRASYAYEHDAFVEPNEQSPLPNLPQDQYDRALNPRPFKTAILENDFLRATFLLETGGRLWSLVDKTGAQGGRDGGPERELLFKNPVFRPANLAVRDAWFAGGIEWNISLIGHTPFTCSPLFAARITAPDKTPALRLYEWDRIRGVPWQIDFLLPEKSRFLLARMRIINPWPRSVPMYWWSNMAVPEQPGLRVLGPAADARRHAYNGEIVRHPLPISEGMDVTYPGNRPYARDLYFCIPENRRPWIAALDAAGDGLVQTSTDRLRGRKVFNWGTAQGGRRWQEFLSLPGQAYIEIQAGLAPTQGEYVRMPAHTTWDWLEAFGPMHVDPAQCHSADWPAAGDAVERQLETILPRAQIDRLFHGTQMLADLPPEEILHHGSGWGALERRRREKSGESSVTPAALPFPDSALTADQLPWLALLETGELPARSPNDPPLSPIVQPEWRGLLEQSLARKKSDHWLAWNQLGIMLYHAGDTAAAVNAWQTSVHRAANPWALRHLAVHARQNQRFSDAADLLQQSWNLKPDSLALFLELAAALLAAGRHDQLLALIGTLPPGLPPRVQLLGAQAALAAGNLDAVADFFKHPLEIPTMREGEVSLSALWFNYHEARLGAGDAPLTPGQKAQIRAQHPPPAWLDFRATAEN